MKFLKSIAAACLLWSVAFAAPKTQDPAQTAIIKEMRKDGGQHVLQLDFVEIRECNCDAGIEIINKNAKLRTFTADAATRIQLLKDAAEFRAASFEELAAGLAGKNLGWPFSQSTPFEFHFDKSRKRILEIRQIYFP